MVLKGFLDLFGLFEQERKRIKKLKINITGRYVFIVFYRFGLTKIVLIEN